MNEYTATESGIRLNNGKGIYYVSCTGGGSGSLDFLIDEVYETAVELEEGDHLIVTIPPGQVIRVTVHSGLVRMSPLPHHTA